MKTFLCIGFVWHNNETQLRSFLLLMKLTSSKTVKDVLRQVDVKKLCLIVEGMLAVRNILLLR